MPMAGLSLTQYACLKPMPAPGLRQALIFPKDAQVRPAGLIRERQVLLELDDGRVLRIHFHRNWLPTPSNLELLVSALADCHWQPGTWTEMANLLSWKLETQLVVKECNLAGLEPDAAAVRALALEQSLAITDTCKTDPVDIRLEVELIEKKIRLEWAERLSEFSGQLDPRIVGLAGLWPSGLTLARYNWLVGGGSNGPEWRIQSALVFPALIPLLAGERGGIQATEADLARVIDEGRPLIQALCDTYGVRKAIARHALTMPSWLFNGEPHIRFGVLLRGLSALPPERYPHTDDDWRVYAHLLHELLPTLTGRPAESPVNAAFLSTISTRGWTVTEQKLERVGLGYESSLRMREFMTVCVRILAEEIEETRQESELEARLLANKLLDRIFVTIGMVELAKLAQRWPALLRKSQSLHEEWGDHMRGKHWPSVITEPFEWESSRVVALTRPAELAEEGRVMGHCAGTYIQNCLNGYSYLFSVRTPDDMHMATGELRFRPRGVSGRFQIVVVQLKGPGNKYPSSQATKGFHAFMRFLDTDAGQARIAQVVAIMTKARKWRLQGESGRLSKRIAHEIERDALKQMGHPLLELRTLVRLPHSTAQPTETIAS